MTDQTTDPTQTTDSGHGNPPPKQPPTKDQPASTDSLDDSGHGNPPPPGTSSITADPSTGTASA